MESKEPLTKFETVKRAAYTALIALIGGVGGGGVDYVRQPHSDMANAMTPSSIQEYRLSQVENEVKNIKDSIVPVISDLKSATAVMKKEIEHLQRIRGDK